MNISKTMFKAYAKCNRMYGLDEIYKKKLGLSESIFEKEEVDKVIDMLDIMFNEETGEDLINVSNAQSEAMLEYYNEVEQEAIKIAEKVFDLKIEHNKDTKKQKLFSFYKDNHQLYCYLDGYCEKEDNIYIFEVKATTTKKFLDMGCRYKKEFYPLFERKGNIIEIKKDYQKDAPLDKLNILYKTLFDRFSPCGKYVYDIAVERYIVENSIKAKYPGLNKKHIKYYLTILNSDYCFDGKYVNNKPVYEKDENNNELVNFIDLDEVTRAYQEKIEESCKEMIENFSMHMKDPIFDSHCEFKKPGKCSFCKVCFPKLFEKGNILEYLQGKSFKDEKGVNQEVKEYINKGLYKLEDVPLEYLKRNQKIQRICHEKNEIYQDIKKIKDGINMIKYPIYHLDFESFPCPLPRFRMEKPYMQSLFQFSLHIEKEPFKCDKEKDHYSFLAKDFSDCREELVKALIEKIDLSNGGTVLVYNDSFESTRIKELSIMFNEYRSELLKINNHIFDLLDIVKTNKGLYEKLGYEEEDAKKVNYYNNDLVGSYSIKKVLPIFSDLSYKTLDVKNGTEAIATYAMFPHMNKEDLEENRKALESYCKQDTWSMVVILWGLMKMVK